MSDSENEMLISAYLDGELTAEERLRVEKLLVAKAEARQLLEELRVLRAGLQDLPQHRLEPGFAQQVLDRAAAERQGPETTNRKSPTHSIASSPVQPAAANHISSSIPDSSIGRRLPIFGSRRGISWSLAAVAAAVLTAVTTRQQPARQIAQNVDRNLSAVPVITRSVVSNSGHQSESAAAPAEEPMLAAKPVAGFRSENGERASGIAADQRSTLGTTTPEIEKLAKDKSPRNQSDQSPQQAVPLVVEKKPAEMFGAAPDFNDQKSTEMPPNPGSDLAANSLAASKSTLQLPAAAAAEPALGGAPMITAPPMASGKLASSGANALLPTQQLERQLSPSASSVLVVHVEVSPDADRRGVFADLLAKNRITLGDSQIDDLANSPLAKERSQPDAAEAKRKSLDLPPDVELNDSELKSKARVLGNERSRADQLERNEPTKQIAGRAPAPLSNETEVFYVEAEPQQIAATLAGMQSDRNDFLGVVVNDSQKLNDSAVYQWVHDSIASAANKAIDKQLPSREKQVGEANSNRQTASGLAGSAGGGQLAGAAPGIRASGGGFGGGTAAAQDSNSPKAELPQLQFMGGDQEAQAAGEKFGLARRLSPESIGNSLAQTFSLQEQGQPAAQASQNRPSSPQSKADSVSSLDSGHGGNAQAASTANSSAPMAPSSDGKSVAAVVAPGQIPGPQRVFFLLRVVNPPAMASPSNAKASGGAPAVAAPANSN